MRSITLDRHVNAGRTALLGQMANELAGPQQQVDPTMDLIKELLGMVGTLLQYYQLQGTQNGQESQNTEGLGLNSVLE